MIFYMLYNSTPWNTAIFNTSSPACNKKIYYQNLWSHTQSLHQAMWLIIISISINVNKTSLQFNFMLQHIQWIILHLTSSWHQHLCRCTEHPFYGSRTGLGTVDFINALANARNERRHYNECWKKLRKLMFWSFNTVDQDSLSVKLWSSHTSLIALTA